MFNKPANILVPMILFVIFTPGLLLSLPSERSPKWQIVLTHVVLFGAVYAILRTVFKTYY